MTLSRRSILKATGLTIAPAGVHSHAQTVATGDAAKVPFGLDLFSLRSQDWTPIQSLDWCAQRHIKVVHFSEIRFLHGLDPDNLKRIRAHAEQLGINVEIGMRSICPTSTLFDKSQGTAEEQIARMVDAAR